MVTTLNEQLVSGIQYVHVCRVAVTTIRPQNAFHLARLKCCAH